MLVHCNGSPQVDLSVNSDTLSWIRVKRFFDLTHYWLITERQTILTLPEHLGSPPVYSGVHVARSLAICVVFCRSLSAYFWLLYCLSIVLFVWFKASDYSSGIYKLFFDLTQTLVEQTIYFTLNANLLYVHTSGDYNGWQKLYKNCILDLTNKM